MSTVPDQPQAAAPSDVAAEETSPVTDEATAVSADGADASQTSAETPETSQADEPEVAETEASEPEEPEAEQASEPEVAEASEPEVEVVEDEDDAPPEPPATTGSVMILDPDDASDDEVVILDADSSSDSSADSDDDVLILVEDDGPSEEEIARIALEARVSGLEAELAAAQTEAKSNKTRLLRTAADYENFRRRTTKEKEDLERFAAQRVIREFLPVIDNLERALKHGPDGEEAPVTSLREGVEMVMKQFKQALAKQGVVGFDSEGEMFDPQVHEAIQQVDSDEHPTGTIVNEFQRGYHIHDKLLRPALVVVARNTSEEQA